MESHKFSPYEYLTFIFPGLTLLATLVYGWRGWPYGEPGLAAFLGLVSAGFLVGHLVTAVANWVEPSYWGDKPGGRVSSTRGLFGKGGLYDDKEWKEIERIFEELHPRLSNLDSRFRLEYSLSLKGPLGDRLQTFVDQIGFHRAMATACAASLTAVIAFAAADRNYLAVQLWGPIFALATLAFATRYRRFWVRLGDYVVREAIARGENKASTGQTTASDDS